MKTVALYDICGKIPNLALMKISTYWRMKGYKTVLCRKTVLPEAVHHYASSVFHHPRACRELAELKSRLGDNLVVGGSGVDIKRTLPPEIDHCFPDYSLYRFSHYALGFLSRGCNVGCPFCLVQEKEGRLKENYATFDDFVPAGQKNVMLLDANLLATRNACETLEEIIRRGYRVNFSQSLDIRYLSADMLLLLKKIQSVNSRFTKPMYYFACNSQAQAAIFREKREWLRDLGSGRVTVLVMFGFDTTLSEDYAVLEMLRELNLIPFLQKYRPLLGQAPRRPANYFDMDIDKIAAIRFRTNGQNNEKFLAFVNKRYFETFGQYYLPLLEARYRYNRKHVINRYLKNPAIVTRQPYAVNQSF